MESNCRINSLNSTTSTEHSNSKDIQEEEPFAESLTNLIINYLPQSIVQEELYNLFESFGPIVSCRLIRHRGTGESLGYGFVNFSSAEAAAKAVQKLNGVRILRKTLKVVTRTSYDVTMMATIFDLVSYARPSNPQIKDTNLYFSGLPSGYNINKLTQYFEPFGKIIASRVLTDQLSGYPRGVGFVRFDKRIEAERAIASLHNKTLDGKPLVVKFAKNPLYNHRHNNHNKCPRRAHSDRKTRAPNGLEVMTSSPRHDFCIFVFNLDPEWDEINLWNLFGPYGAISSVKIMREEQTGRCIGYGFVNMINKPEAVNAVRQLNGKHVFNRVLQVSFKK